MAEPIHGAVPGVVPMATDLRVEAEDSPRQLAAIGGALSKAGINVDNFCAVDAAREALVVSGVEDRPGDLGETAAVWPTRA